MAKKSIPTIYALQAQNAQYRGRQHVVMTNTSLNQKWDIQANLTYSETDRLAARYFAIGDGGHKNALGTGNRPITKFNYHTPDDAALFNQLPFVLRQLNNDLQPTDREKYRHRKIVNIGGTSYVAYYLKLLSDADSQATTQVRTEVDGVVSNQDFVPTLSNLSPTPQTDDHLLELSNQYLVVTSVVNFTLSSDEVADLLNVTNILYGDDSYAIISEIAVVQGVDRTVIGDLNGQPISYTEAIGAQCANFVANDTRLTAPQDTFALSVDISGIQPLFTP